MIEVRQTPAFRNWFEGLTDRMAQKRILVRIGRLERGNFGDVKPVGKAVIELRVPYGPGYRLYFVRDGGATILLLCGGDKGSQARDIRTAQRLAEGNCVMASANKTTRWDAAVYLESDEDIAEYLAAAFETGEAEDVTHALATIARARGMSEIARNAGLARGSLYKAIGEGATRPCHPAIRDECAQRQPEREAEGGGLNVDARPQPSLKTTNPGLVYHRGGSPLANAFTSVKTRQQRSSPPTFKCGDALWRAAKRFWLSLSKSTIFA